jgi:diguanylate cyclase (GGDEF)-like protein
MPDNASPRLLVVEDDADTASLISETLADHFDCDRTRVCYSLSEALTVDLNEIDLVLSDMNLPDGTGLDLLDNFLSRRADLPIIFVTGESVLDHAMRAIRRGAYDYIVKAGDYLFTIPVMVEKNLAIWKTKQDNLRLQHELQRTLDQVKNKNQQLVAAVTKLEMVAATDPLTGLANRRAFGQALEQRFADCGRTGRDLACIMIDLDGFKALNDTLGHQTGDDLLQRVARVLEANCRRSDVAARFGGDEFVVLLPGADTSHATHIATRIADEFNLAAQSVLGDAPSCAVSMSMGLSTLVSAAPANPEQIIAQADHALYRAKQSGKSRLMIYAPPPRHGASTGHI